MLRRISVAIGSANFAIAKRFGGTINKVVTAADAVGKIKDGSCVAVAGFVCVGCAEELCASVEKRFQATGSPKDLTVVFQGGPGDFKDGGVSRFAHLGLVRRSIGGHYGQCVKMRELASENKIESYIFPMGALSRMMRCAASGQPAHITSIGCDTMVDPKHGGGKLNEKAKEALVKDITIDGKRYLAYQPLNIDVALIRGTYGDTEGNISFHREALYNENLIMAMAARARRGLVIAQVEKVVAAGTLKPHEVLIPGTMVNYVVEAKPENHKMGYFLDYDPSVSGEVRVPVNGNHSDKWALDIRKIVARRAAYELNPDNIVNLGIGMPDGVAVIAEEENCLDFITLTTEPGVHSGSGLKGHNFGPARNHSALLTMDHQFDFYNGGGLDIAFLGNAETDPHGNVNVTKVGGKITGPGGFIDITQATKLVNLLGTFTAVGLEVAVENGKLKINKEGKLKKFIKNIAEISFSGTVAREKKQQVKYITERCVFEMTKDGLELIEVAPGMDVQKNILDQMEFKPLISKNLKEMDSAIFKDEPMNLRDKLLAKK